MFKINLNKLSKNNNVKKTGRCDGQVRNSGWTDWWKGKLTRCFAYKHTRELTI